MKKVLLLSVMFLTLTGCSTLQRAGLAGLGAAGGSFLGPAGAAVGAAGGVIASDVIDANGNPQQIIADNAAQQVGQPQGSVASTVHESKDFIQTIGYWYLLLFVLVPFITKRGRSWFGKFTQLHNSVSKKDVESQLERLNRVEGFISQQQTEDKK